MTKQSKGDAAVSYPQLAPDEWSRGKLVRELQEHGYFAVADDVADGVPLGIVHARLGDDASENTEALELVSRAAQDLGTGSHVLVLGDPGSGFELVGPFGDHEDAQREGERQSDQSWWVMDLSAPERAGVFS